MAAVRIVSCTDGALLLLQWPCWCCRGISLLSHGVGVGPSMGHRSCHGVSVLPWDVGSSMGYWSFHGVLMLPWDVDLSMGHWTFYGTLVLPWDVAAMECPCCRGALVLPLDISSAMGLWFRHGTQVLPPGPAGS